MSSKTVEEAFEEWVDKNPLGRMSIHQSRKAAFTAGAAHGAAEEREAMIERIQQIAESYSPVSIARGVCEAIISGIRQRGEK